MLYSGLPADIRGEVHSYCSPPALAALTLTSKATNADFLLYRHIYLTALKPFALELCLQTLAENVPKAALVRSLQVSLEGVASEKQDQRIRDLSQALANMSGLRVFWFVPKPGDHTKEQCKGIEESLCGAFKLEALYTGHLTQVERVLGCQPELKVIGLWYPLMTLQRGGMWKTVAEFRSWTTTLPFVFVMRNTGRSSTPFFGHISCLSVPTTCTSTILRNVPLTFPSHPSSSSFNLRLPGSAYRPNPGDFHKLSLYLSDLGVEDMREARAAVREFVNVFPKTEFLVVDIKPGVDVSSYLVFTPILQEIPDLHTAQIQVHGATASRAELQQIKMFAENCSRSGCLRLRQVFSRGVKVHRVDMGEWIVEPISAIVFRIQQRREGDGL